MNCFELFGWFILAACSAVMVWVICGTIRNEWVYQQRAHLIDTFAGGWLVDYYASYDEMMRKFWIWDIRKFRK